MGCIWHGASLGCVLHAAPTLDQIYMLVWTGPIDGLSMLDTAHRAGLAQGLHTVHIPDLSCALHPHVGYTLHVVPVPGWLHVLGPGPVWIRPIDQASRT